MNNTETSVTVNSQLSTACAPLFDCLPIVVRQDNSLIIYNLPADLSCDALDKSSIINICHQMKHLYSDGDRIGRTGIAKKKHLENNTIRMCISYTYSLRRESEKNVLTISFMPSFTKHHLPRFIQPVERIMDEHEIADQMDIFIGTCREEICELIKKMMDTALEQATVNAIAAFA